MNEDPQAELDKLVSRELVNTQFLPTLFKNVVFQPGIYEVKERGSLRRYFFVCNGAQKEVEPNEDWDDWRSEFYEWVAPEHKANPAGL